MPMSVFTGYINIRSLSDFLSIFRMETIYSCMGYLRLGILSCIYKLHRSFFHRTRYSNMWFKVDLVCKSLLSLFSDDTQHDRHHHFIKDPEKVYQENDMKYCFGDKYITPEVRFRVYNRYWSCDDQVKAHNKRIVRFF